MTPADDIIAAAVRVARLQARHVAEDMTPRLRRYCEMCDHWTAGAMCRDCGADTVRGKRS